MAAHSARVEFFDSLVEFGRETSQNRIEMNLRESSSPTGSGWHILRCCLMIYKNKFITRPFQFSFDPVDMKTKPGLFFLKFLNYLILDIATSNI